MQDESTCGTCGTCDTCGTMQDESTCGTIQISIYLTLVTVSLLDVIWIKLNFFGFCMFNFFVVFSGIFLSFFGTLQ